MDENSENFSELLYRLPTEGMHRDIAGMIIDSFENGLSPRNAVIAGKAFSVDYDDSRYVFRPLMTPSRDGIVLAGQPITNEILKDMNCSYSLFFSTLYSVVNVYMENLRKSRDIPARLTLSDLIRKICQDKQVNTHDIRLRKFFFSVIRSWMFTEMSTYMFGRDGELLEPKYGQAVQVLVSVGNENNYKRLNQEDVVDCVKEVYFHLLGVFPALLDESKLSYFCDRSGDFFIPVTGTTEKKIGTIEWQDFVNTRVEETLRIKLPAQRGQVSKAICEIFGEKPFSVLTINVDTLSNLAGAKNRTDVFRLRNNFLKLVESFSVVKHVSEVREGPNRVAAYNLYIELSQ